MSFLIGLGRKARQGKDTVAKTIIDKFGGRYDIRRYAFADALKREVDELGPLDLCLEYGIDYDMNPSMDDPLCRTKHGKQSRLLQFWGEKRRKENSFYWISKVRQKVDEENPTIALITDMRYKNEGLWVRSKGGVTVDVQRVGYKDYSRDPHHISETDLDNWPFDYTIQVMHDDLPELQRSAVELFQLIEQEYSVQPGDVNALLRSVA